VISSEPEKPGSNVMQEWWIKKVVQGQTMTV